MGGSNAPTVAFVPPNGTLPLISLSLSYLEGAANESDNKTFPCPYGHGSSMHEHADIQSATRAQAASITLDTTNGLINGSGTSTINGVTVSYTGTVGGVADFTVYGDLDLLSTDSLTAIGSNGVELIVGNNVNIASGATINLTAGTAGGAAASSGGGAALVPARAAPAAPARRRRAGRVVGTPTAAVRHRVLAVPVAVAPRAAALTVTSLGPAVLVALGRPVVPGRAAAVAPAAVPGSRAAATAAAAVPAAPATVARQVPRALLAAAAEPAELV